MKFIVFLIILIGLSGCACKDRVMSDCHEECGKQITARSVQYNEGYCGTSCIFQICYPF